MSWLHESEFTNPLRQSRWSHSPAPLPVITQLALLLTHPDPPLELLECAKDFAKRHLLAQQNSSIPTDVSQMIYLAAIAVAFVRWRVMITALDRASLCRGLLWAMTQPWIEPPIKHCLAECLTRLHHAP